MIHVTFVLLGFGCQLSDFSHERGQQEGGRNTFVGAGVGCFSIGGDFNIDKAFVGVVYL